jgi:hypothetical protein
MRSCLSQISTGKVALLSAVDFCVGMNRVGDCVSEAAGVSPPSAGGVADELVSAFVDSLGAESAGAGVGVGAGGTDCALGVSAGAGAGGSS